MLLKQTALYGASYAKRAELCAASCKALVVQVPCFKKSIALLNQTAQYGQVDEHVLFGRVQPLMLSVTVDLVAL